MKKILCILLLMSTGVHFLNAQSSVAIGDANTKASAVLYLKGNGNQGFIIPIVTNTSSIPTPEAGMIVYNSTDKNVYYHNGSAWAVIGSVSGGSSTPILSNGQLLTGNGTTNAASTLGGDATLSGGTITISNNAITSAKIADGTIAAADLNAMSATSGQVLKFNGTAWAPAADAGGVTYTGGAGINVAGSIITNTGDTNASDDLTTASTAAGDVTGLFSNLQIGTGAVTTTEIADGTIVNADIANVAPGKITQAAATTGQVLKWDGTTWAPAADAGGITYTGGTGINVAGSVITNTGDTNATDDLTTASTAAGDVTGLFSNLQIGTGTVTSTEIADGTIAAADLNAMSATNGQVLKYNGTSWAPSTDDVGGGATPTLSNGQILTGNGTTNAASTLTGDATLSGGTITISNNAVTSIKIADGSIVDADITSVAPGKITQAAATTGQVLKWNGTAWAPAADAGGAGTVTAVSVATANGFSGTSSGGATPALTLTTPVNGIIKGNGTAMTAAIAGTDYLTPTGSAAGLTGFPTLNQNTTGTASTITGTITQSQVTSLTTDLANKVTANGAITPGTNTKITYDAKGLVTAGAALTASDLPVMTATVGGAVPTPPNNTTTFLRGDGTFATPAGGGTVTAVSVATANGFSGTSSGGATPALTIVAGAITPTSVAATGTVTGSNLSGTNTGDNAVNTLYSGLVSNATHTGDATGATALTVRGINGVLMSGLGTGIVKNTTGTGVPSIATGADLPVMTATVGGAVPTPPNNTTTFLRGDGTFAAPPVGGTVTTVSVATANGVSGSVATPTTTPAITLTLGAITPTSVAATGTVTGSNLSGTNTGDNAVNTLYSGLVSNATHTGDATGATALTVQGINGVLLSGLGTGILKNTTGTGVPSIATGADLPVMTATVGGAVPTPPNNTTTFLRGDGTFAVPSGSSGWGLTGNLGTTFGTNFIGTTDNIGLSFKTNNLQRMYINNLGQMVVDINNTNPISAPVSNAILDIVPNGAGIGNMVLRGSFANQSDPVDIEFRTWNGATTLGRIFMNPSASDMWFDANGATRLALQNDGDVGIGTTNPGQKLDVVGNANISSGSSYMIGGTSILNNTGTANIFVGGNNSTAGSNNVSIGTAAGRDNAATDNTFVGRNAGLANTTGTLNVYVGSNAGANVGALTASGNTFVGYLAGSTNTTGVRNVLIGREANVGAAGLQNAIAIGYQAIAGASNTMVLGGTGANAVNVGVGITTPSKRIHAVSAPAATFDAAIYGSSSATDGAGFFGAMAYDVGTTNFGLYAHSDAIANTLPLGVNRGADGALVNFYSANSLEGQIGVSGTTITYGAFTGVHYAQTDDETIERGMLVSLNGKNGNLHDKKTSEALYGITKTAVPNDTKVMGTYLGLMDPLVEKSSDNPIQIMAVGNGDMWIVDNGKNLEVGDYLISSDLAGYAMLDKSDYDIAHVIARIGQNVNWNDVQQKVNGRKVINVSVFFENFEINHKAEKLIAEIEVLNSKINSMKEKQDTEVALLKEQMEEVLRIMGASAKRKN